MDLKDIYYYQYVVFCQSGDVQYIASWEDGFKGYLQLSKRLHCYHALVKVCVAISQLANLEAQALFKKKPYGEILKHVRAQLVHYNKPSCPTLGLTKGHSSRIDWNVSYSWLNLSFFQNMYKFQT